MGVFDFAFKCEGAPGWVHGGATAALCDCAVAYPVKLLKAPGATLRLSIRNVKPVLLGSRVVLLRSCILDKQTQPVATAESSKSADARTRTVMWISVTVKDVDGECYAEASGEMRACFPRGLLCRSCDVVPPQGNLRHQAVLWTPARQGLERQCVVLAACTALTRRAKQREHCGRGINNTLYVLSLDEPE